MLFNFSQYILDNVEEATAGVKGENSVKVFGPDIEQNEKYADAIVDVMATVPGIADLGIFKSLGQPNVKITPDRKQLARYGLNTGDVANVVQSALGGLTGNGNAIVRSTRATSSSTSRCVGRRSTAPRSRPYARSRSRRLRARTSRSGRSRRSSR